MATEANPPVPVWYWIVAVLALMWAAAGCFAYVSQVTISPEDFARLPAAQQQIWAAMPGWATGAYAVAVWISLAGAGALLLRRRLARTAYLVSLVAVLIQFGWVFLASPILSLYPLVEAAAFPLFIVVLGVFLLWFSHMAAGRGWLR
ncbi:MAG: hypothetical protein KF780_13895 [Sphingomonas sp.]|nr:hypothetical protein [Sphingomonas sp.]